MTTLDSKGWLLKLTTQLTYPSSDVILQSKNSQKIRLRPFVPFHAFKEYPE